MISVCIATYNGEKYIKEQLSSILCQLDAEDEIVVSDDGSTDETINIIKNFNDSRVRVIQNRSKHGIIWNFENALKNCTGDYIFLSDQDDIWHSSKVKVCNRYFQSGEVLIVSDAYIINQAASILYQSYFNILKSKAGIIRNLKFNSYLGCCMAFSRSVLDSALPFPKHIVMHDIWIGLVSELLYKPIFIEEKLVYYRRHDSNCSPSAEKSTHSYYFRIKYRLLLVHEMLFRFGFFICMIAVYKSFLKR